MEFNDSQSIYLQIADLVCEKIIRREWPEGEKILSVRELAVELQVNPNTVMRTYDFLQTEEILINKRGIGLFVPDQGIKKATIFRREQFLKTDLPIMFKNMSLLNIGIKELEEFFEKYKKKK
jgi:GntR family transcriptional regulator